MTRLSGLGYLVPVVLNQVDFHLVVLDLVALDIGGMAGQEGQLARLAA